MNYETFSVQVLGKCGHWFAHDPAVVLPLICPDCADESAENKQEKNVAVKRKLVYNRRRNANHLPRA